MKNLFLLVCFILVTSCTTNDSMYEGPVTNNLCALEVFPVKVLSTPNSFKIPVDSIVAKDPYVRQGGINVCRSY